VAGAVFTCEHCGATPELVAEQGGQLADPTEFIDEDDEF
jgi:hypothetical protein